MIRQAISCDICGTEMQNPNHWFVVYDGGPEFRMTRWNTRTRLRPDARHLCGQTCLHKLVDDFMARTISDRAAIPTPEKSKSEKKPSLPAVKSADTSLTTTPSQTTPIRSATPIPDTYPNSFIDEFESSARLITPIEPEREACSEVAAATPSYNSRSWRAGAWKREREREQRTSTHRRSIA